MTMSEEKKKDLISVFVDGVEVKVAPGANMIKAAEKAGVEIPHYCYHEHLSVAGNCRMCLIEMGMPMRDRATGEPVLDDNGVQKIGWIPRPQIACGTNASPGLQIKTNTPLVKDCQEGVMEFLLVNHPLDCPICDQAGECRLQEFASDYGRGYSRFIEEKNVKPKRTLLGPRVMLDDERCILCSRCIRFSQEIVNDDVLGFAERGSYSTLTCYPGKQLENNYSLNTVDICPVGALTSMDFRFKMRVWFLKETVSICTESSVGVNTTVSSREGEIYRITPRQNDAVNDSWMSDSGRMLYDKMASVDRLTEYTIDGKHTLPAAAAQEAAELIKSGKPAFIGSGQASLEEQYLLKEIVDTCPGAPVYLVGRTGKGDDLLISADRNPNVRGALVCGLIDELPDSELNELAAKIEKGEVTTVFSLCEDLTVAGISPELLAKVQVIYLGAEANETSKVAKALFPTLTVFEKSGSFINQQFRVQRFEQAVPGPAGVHPELNTLSLIGSILRDDDQRALCPQELWEKMSQSLDGLTGMAFDDIPDTGHLIDSAKWSHFPYVEGKSLHYTPPALAADHSTQGNG